jgi:hypothetical protein
MEQLKFGKPVFKPGINLTVRLGDKWDKNFSQERGEDGCVLVDLATVDGKKVGQGRIEFVTGYSFAEIPAYLLVLEHDPTCRTLDGLYNGLKSCYRDQFNAGSWVTLLFFTVNGK